MKVINLSRKIKCTQLTSNEIRDRFINYFIDKNHSKIKSSSVRPNADPSLEFVNAGMNQFKNIFLGFNQAPVLRAVNSQKCIRIGGKHNDLNVVGHDSYHHTFFEMLGNWSFGDYFKDDACTFALELITTPPFSLPIDRLYFTYFKGDKELQLPPDLDTKQIWKSLGIPEDRILPFGLKENFWEMGMTGPCGPCTEIHYDHIGTAPRPHCVNQDLNDLTELWNIVFIQYRRLDGGLLEQLSKNYVDTGMGLERLVALLQGKRSNYDTDLFTPLFDVIHEISGIRPYIGLYGENDKNLLDTSYRIIADHCRMMAVALSDNILPDHSHSLRRVIRKAMILAEEMHPGKSLVLLLAVIEEVSKSFRFAFPEILANLKQIEIVLNDEMTVWQESKASIDNEWSKLVEIDNRLIKLTDCQSFGLMEAYKFIQESTKSHEILPTETAFICYDRFGLNPLVIEELANLKGYTLDTVALEKDILKIKEINKSKILATHSFLCSDTLLNTLKQFPETDDSSKFDYKRINDGLYEFDPLKSKAVAVFKDGNILNECTRIKWGSWIGVLLDKTNFYSSTKGEGDVGQLKVKNKEGIVGVINVEETINYFGRVIHQGKIIPTSDENTNDSMEVGNWEVETQIDKERRVSLMRNSSAYHILTKLMSEKFNSNVISVVNSEDCFTVKLMLFGQQFSEKDTLELQKQVKDIINIGSSIQTSTVSMKDIVSLSDVTVPNFLTSFQGFSQLVNFECNGECLNDISSAPNVLNTKDVIDFIILNFRLTRKNRECSITCMTGNKVDCLVTSAKEFLSRLTNASEEDVIQKLLKEAKNKELNNKIPLELFKNLNEVTEELKIKLKKSRRIKQEHDFKELLKNHHGKYIVHYINGDVKMEKLIKLVEIPVILFAYSSNILTARCQVPKNYKLKACNWLSEVSKSLGTKVIRLKDQDETHVCAIKPIKIKQIHIKDIIEEAKQAADSFAEENLKSIN